MNALMSLRPASLVDDFFRDFAPGFFVRPLHGDPLPQQIMIDVQERDAAFEIQAEIPGVKKEDIHVDLDGNILRLRAEVKQEDRKEEDGRAVYSERYFGAVSRSISLPADVDERNAKAKYENGVLKLTLPKRAGGKRQRLTVE